jgi:hypothetical protein
MRQSRGVYVTNGERYMTLIYPTIKDKKIEIISSRDSVRIGIVTGFTGAYLKLKDVIYKDYPEEVMSADDIHIQWVKSIKVIDQVPSS